MTPHFDPLQLIVPRRKITGISATLLPYTVAHQIDWPGFTQLLTRTAEAGLMPAVNMDTGYGNLLTLAERANVLDATRSALGNRPFAAGAFVADKSGAKFDHDGYCRSMEPILSRGGVPVIVQSFGLTGQPDAEIITAYEQLGKRCDQFIAFELGTMFAPFGRIYSLELFRGLLGVKACVGAKHSSLRRDLEWQRLVVRNEVRPDFKVFTGNDLAIDMVMYGSDYLLGLSTFAPDLFAKRDRYWEQGDPQFHELNDLLQYLGCFAFRDPVPAYKHTAAMLLKLRGWIASNETHPASPRRPESDIGVLEAMQRRLAEFESVD